MSGKHAVGEVANANQMFTNSDRLIVLDQTGFNRQNQIQDTMSSFSVANWVGRFRKEFLSLVGVIVLHVKSGGHLHDRFA